MKRKSVLAAVLVAVALGLAATTPQAQADPLRTWTSMGTPNGGEVFDDD